MKPIWLLALPLLFTTAAHALTGVERAAIWTRCWDTVRYHFTGFDDQGLRTWEADFEPNLRALTTAGSDVEFWRALRMRIAALDDGRTVIQAPSGLPRVYDTVPVRFMLVEDKILLKQIGASIDVQSSGMKIGDELITVDHVPVLNYLRDECLPHVSGSTESGRMAEAVTRVLIGEADSKVHLVLHRPNGDEYSVTLNRDSGPGGENFRDLSKIEGRFVKKFPGDVLYLEIGQRFTANAEQAILDQLAENPKVRHLILDLRDTKYGSVPIRVLQKLALFPLPMGAYREITWNVERSAADPSVVAPIREWRDVKSEMVEPSTEPFRGTVVVLINSETAGPAEQFLEPLVFSDRVALVGDTTAGSGGQVMEVDFGGGAKLAVTVGQPAWESGCGAGKGFSPRVYSVPSFKGLAAGKDDVLQKALEFIRERAD